MTAPTHQCDHLVIGGGLAGSMAALRLASADRNVTLLEKELGPRDKVCGEFLSSEAVAYLRSAGIDPLALGAVAIRTVRLASRDKLVEAALPFTALSLSRRVLDEALLKCAVEHGCNVVRGAFVRSLGRNDSSRGSSCGGSWTACLRNGKSWRASTVLLATGKHDLGGHERDQERGSGSHQGLAHHDLVGFKLHWRLAPVQSRALGEAMDLFLFADGYGGLSLVENDAANLCLVVRQASLSKLGGWPQLLASILAQNHHLRLRLKGATPLWSRPLAIFPIPYGYLAAPRDGLWRLGDQAAVIPSFTGDGMSIALHSGALASEMLLVGRSAIEFQSTLSAQLRRAMRISTFISQAMVTGAGRSLAPVLLSLVPNALGWIASSTRIPEESLAGIMAQ